MNKTAQKHVAAIKAGKVDGTNVRGLRKLINASERAASGYSLGVSSCHVSLDDLFDIEQLIQDVRPTVTGELHETGLALLQSKRYAKRLHWQQSYIARIGAFRLVRFDRIGRREEHCVPVYQACAVERAGSCVKLVPLFTFRNIPWQSGGNGPEIQGTHF